MSDKFSAVWVSHSSIADFQKCPRAYYLKNVYKDPQTKRKIQLMAPPLALGSAVHEVLEALSVKPTNERLKVSLLTTFEQVWKKFQGKRGGFLSLDEEQRYKLRGQEMLRRVMENPGPIERLAVKIKEDLPHYWLSAEDNIILCGKIDWLEYFPDSDSVHIIDFKTSKSEEDSASLQLPIYHLLVHNCQHRKVTGASYWYLDFAKDLTSKQLPDLEQAHQQVLEVARKIKTIRALEKYDCPNGSEGCYACRPYEAILKGQAELVGQNDYGNNVYVLPSKQPDLEHASEVL